MIQNQIPKTVKFGTIDIKSSYIFYFRKYVYCCVNLKLYLTNIDQLLQGTFYLFLIE